MEVTLSETEGANQVLRDEHQALQIAYASIEEKLKILHVRLNLLSSVNAFHLITFCHLDLV